MNAPRAEGRRPPAVREAHRRLRTPAMQHINSNMQRSTYERQQATVNINGTRKWYHAVRCSPVWEQETVPVLTAPTRAAATVRSFGHSRLGHSRLGQFRFRGEWPRLVGRLRAELRRRPHAQGQLRTHARTLVGYRRRAALRACTRLAVGPGLDKTGRVPQCIAMRCSTLTVMLHRIALHVASHCLALHAQPHAPD